MSTKKMNATIDEIAREILGLETLETRHSDSLDFHDTGVWSIRKALKTASPCTPLYEIETESRPFVSG